MKPTTLKPSSTLSSSNPFRWEEISVELQNSEGSQTLGPRWRKP